MAYLRSKHFAVSDIKSLLSKYSCVLTDTNFVYYIIITRCDIVFKDSVGSGEKSLPLRNVLILWLAFKSL
jgi:hypothetical protein